MRSDPQSFFRFVQQSPTAFHAVRTVSAQLEASGFRYLDETECWQLTAGGKYYTTKNNSALIAFILPSEPFTHFQIISSHADSPMLKLKPSYESPSGNCYIRLNVEVYGGMIMSTWLDRPLSIAGRVILRNQNQLETRLIDLEEDVALIPNMPIHFNRDINDGYKYNPQVDLLPLYGESADKNELLSHLAKSVDAAPDQIVGSDLFLYSRTSGSVWGAQKQFFSCPRIDDLECAYTSLQSFLSVDKAPDKMVPVYALFDNEEVGSGSKQGADSTFLTDVLSQIHTAFAHGTPFSAVLARSFMLSADNAHAVHPNHPEKYDEQNRVYMNKGIVIKHSANQKYTTDGLSSAVFEDICHRNGIPVQHFTNRSDIRGGSTLGNIANTHASMNTADIGLAQLAMHSSYETAGCSDIDYMIDALKAFYKTNIFISGNGLVTLG